ncbi:MAG: phosphoribosyltransferase family protein [Acidaminococcaceae bacterium]|nr:phosphoribosyltransferase family protein [Acidaminococcaceae bacterium]
MLFHDRYDAGKRLAEKLEAYRGQNVEVFAMPRGGVPLGAEIAGSLKVPLNLIITKKIGHPHNPEYAVGAVSEMGSVVYNQDEISEISPLWLEQEIKNLREEINRRRSVYLPGRCPTDLGGKTVVIVDDGIATGYTMAAAIEDLKKTKPTKIVVAIPVVPEEIALRIAGSVDELVSLRIEKFYLGAVGSYYENFSQLQDAEVIALLSSSKEGAGAKAID